MWQTVRVVLVVLWAGWAALAWWTAPRPADPGDALTAEPAAVAWGSGWDGPIVGRPGDLADLVGSGESIVAWRTPALRIRYVRDAGPDVRAALGPARGDLRPLYPLIVGGHVVVGLFVLAVLVRGPAPVRGTRWFWFWSLVLPPADLGLLLWLALERPWSRRVRPLAPVPSGRDPRRAWWEGLGLSLLVSAAYLLVVLLAGWILGPEIVPENPD